MPLGGAHAACRQGAAGSLALACRCSGPPLGALRRGEGSASRKGSLGRAACGAALTLAHRAARRAAKSFLPRLSSRKRSTAVDH